MCVCVAQNSAFMAANLRKFKYEASSNTRSSAAGGKSSNSTAEKEMPKPATPPKHSMDATAIKTDILVSIRQDISTIIKQEIKDAMADHFESLKREIQDVKTEINSNTAAIRAELEQVKANVRSVEDGMSTWSDEMVAMRGTVSTLQKEMKVVKDKCEDLEGQMRRCNIRIIGVAELKGSSTPEAVSSLLKEVFRLDREVCVERSHRSLVQWKPGEKPRAIIARLSSERDAVDILRRARSSGGKLVYKANPIAIFPDYTSSVVKARAAFTDVRKMLRNRPGVRYGIIFPAKFRVTHNNVEREFVDAAEAMDYVKGNILQSADEDM
uniref:L1 transposable element RRM domain-containing protein n=1 Tax=Gouania willdenowi TaxID=441366 RepID=A0A8C5FZK1_GOUWI